MTTTAPQTHSQARKVAETVTPAELADLIASTSSFTVLRPRSPRWHAIDAIAYDVDDVRATVRVDRATATGETVADWIFPTTRQSPSRAPIFDFYNLGRIVRVGGPDHEVHEDS